MSDQCASSGVLAPLTGTIGSMQATEVIKLLFLAIATSIRESYFTMRKDQIGARFKLTEDRTV